MTGHLVLGIDVSSAGVFGTTLAGGGITNTGKISGSDTGIDLFRDGTVEGAIRNAGTISAATGMGIWASSVTVLGNSAAGGITNTGIIKAGRSGINLSVVGIFTGGIVNAASISEEPTALPLSTMASSPAASSTPQAARSAAAGPPSQSEAFAAQGASTFLGGIINSGIISRSPLGHPGRSRRRVLRRHRQRCRRHNQRRHHRQRWHRIMSTTFQLSPAA